MKDVDSIIQQYKTQLEKMKEVLPAVKGKIAWAALLIPLCIAIDLLIDLVLLSVVPIATAAGVMLVFKYLGELVTYFSLVPIMFFSITMVKITSFTVAYIKKFGKNAIYSFKESLNKLNAIKNGISYSEELVEKLENSKNAVNINTNEINYLLQKCNEAIEESKLWDSRKLPREINIQVEEPEENEQVEEPIKIEEPVFQYVNPFTEEVCFEKPKARRLKGPEKRGNHE